MKSFIGGFFLFSLFLVGCRSTKVTNTQGTADSSLGTKEILSNHVHSFPTFETLVGTLDVSFDNGRKQQNLPLSFRMKKNETIWLSAPLGIAKALITKDKVRFYNKLDATYFEGDYSISQQYLGVSFTFEMLQNLLMGQLILKSRHTEIEPVHEKYKGKLSAEHLEVAFELNSKFRMETTELLQESENRSLQASYTYQSLDDQLFPLIISLLARQEEKVTKLTLQFNNLQKNTPVRFPYNVPTGYQPLTLNL